MRMLRLLFPAIMLIAMSPLVPIAVTRSAAAGGFDSSTTVSDSTSVTPTDAGGSITFTASVAEVNSIEPSGTITWTLTGPLGTSPSCSSSTLSAGEALCTVSDVSVGTYGATANYSGDSNYSPSSGSDSSAVVTALVINQISPIDGETLTTESNGFAIPLGTSGGVGSVTFGGSLPSGFTLNATTGVITVGATLAVNSYVLSGTDSDAYGDDGTWSYTLTVLGASLDSVNPSGSTTTTASPYFNSNIDAPNALSYVVLTPATGVNVNLATGAITTSGELRAGTYVVEGKYSDAYGDTGGWSFTLTVNPATFPQAIVTGTTTTIASSGFIGNVGVAGNGDYDLVSSTTGISFDTSTGAITTTGELHAGTYTVAGTYVDAYGDDGTWSYTLTVNAVTLGAVNAIYATTTSASISDGSMDLPSGGTANTDFSSDVPVDVVVTGAGTIDTDSSIPAGVYTVSGTYSDVYGDTGTWTYTLTVTDSTLASVNATGLITTASSGSAGSIGASGAASYSVTTGVTGIIVDSATGAVSTTVELTAGTYELSGAYSDTDGDTGTWTYTLTVAGYTLASVSGSGTTSTIASWDFAGSVGATDAESYTVTTGATGVSVNSTSGAISTTGELAAGTYELLGTYSDAYGDTGVWSYILTVNTAVLSSVNASGTTTTVTSLDFTGNVGAAGAVSYVAYAEATGVVMNPETFAVSTTGELTTGTYVLSGTYSDAYGDTGTWTYTLTVDGVTLSPFNSSATTTTTASSGFAGHIGAVDVVVSTPATGVSVDTTTGAVSTTGELAAGIYELSGTYSDAYGDTGTWTYTLTVNGVTLTSLNSNDSTTTTASSDFTDSIGAAGAISYSVTTSATGVSVDTTSGAVSTTGELAAGIYALSGTYSDAYGDTGAWTYSLTVNGATLSTVSASGSTTTTASSDFTGSIGAAGATSYSVTTSATGVTVNATTGAVSTTGALSTGTYVLSGTYSDNFGNTGLWSYTLSIVNATTTATTTTPGNAPASSGLPSSDYGTPVSTTILASNPSTLSATSGGASTSLSIPADALPAGTTLSVYPITTTLAPEITSGTSYMAAFDVSWQTLSGTTPNATTPIVMTITDPSIVAGDTVYILTPTGLSEVGSATTNGTITFTFSSDPIFVLTSSHIAKPARPGALTVTFSGSSSRLTTKDRTSLDALAKKLVAGATVVITGYAKDNLQLARARGLQVRAFLSAHVKVHVTLKTSTASNKATVITTSQ